MKTVQIIRAPDIIRILDGHFRDPEKTDRWIRAGNSLLRGIRPWDLLQMGKAKKLMLFIKKRLDANKPLMRRRKNLDL